MKILEKLTFADTTKKAQTTQPSLILRRKMVAILSEQLEAANAEIAGQPFSKKVEKWKRMEDGSKSRFLVQTVIRKIWYRDSENRVLIELRFGNKPLIINGKPSSIVVGDIVNLPNVLTMIREAVSLGELDRELAVASENRRRIRRGKSAVPAGIANTTTKPPSSTIKIK
ncbi:MAG: hypothetical protein WCF85_07340 [Rhodospirillaceae bacterium]